jgi:hypothetical protein
MKVTKSSDIVMYHPSWIEIKDNIPYISGGPWYYGDNWNIANPFSIFIPSYELKGYKHTQVQWGVVIKDIPFHEDWKTYIFPKYADTGHNWPDPEYYILDISFKLMKWRIAYCYPKPNLAEMKHIILKGDVIADITYSKDTIHIKGTLKNTSGKYYQFECSAMDSQTNSLVGHDGAGEDTDCDILGYDFDFTGTKITDDSDVRKQVSPEGAYSIDKQVVFKVVRK